MANPDQFEWVEVANYDEMSVLAADLFQRQLNSKPESILGLATGGSPLGFYEELVESYKRGEVSFANSKTFNLDEYIGVAPPHTTSYHYYMDHHLFNHIDLPQTHRNLPNGMAANLVEECERYEMEIAMSGGIDLQLLGIGVNGHIGFNEPGTSFLSRTHIVNLAASTREVNTKHFPSANDVPRQAITMGIQTIMNAKKIILLAFGKQKMNAVERLRNGEITENLPASCLREHPHVTVFYGE